MSGKVSPGEAKRGNIETKLKIFMKDLNYE